jgi:hypothetical protein
LSSSSKVNSAQDKLAGTIGGAGYVGVISR